MSIEIRKNNCNKLLEEYTVFEVYPTPSKETYPRIGVLNDQVRKLYTTELNEYYPNFLIVPKNEKASIKISYNEEIRPVICFESPSHLAMGILHKRQLDLYSKKIFKEILKEFDPKELLKVSAFVNESNKWSINSFIGKIFECFSGSVVSYKAVEICGQSNIFAF